MNSKLFFIFLSLTVSTRGFCQLPFSTLEQSTDSTYGYTSRSPLKMKKGDPVESVGYSEQFLGRIDSISGQAVRYTGRTTIRDPNRKKPFLQLTDQFTGKPLTGNGKTGLLDVYHFIRSQSNDTVAFYVDIYHKGTLKLPVGCSLRKE